MLKIKNEQHSETGWSVRVAMPLKSYAETPPDLKKTVGIPVLKTVRGQRK